MNGVAARAACEHYDIVSGVLGLVIDQVLVSLQFGAETCDDLIFPCLQLGQGIAVGFQAGLLI